MTYRVIFDFGDVEISIMYPSTLKNFSLIADEAAKSLLKKGITFNPDEAIIDVTPAPEWEED